MKELLTMLTQRLVDHPEAVEVEEFQSSFGVTYHIHVGEGDTGKVIGRSGRVIQALRTVVKAAATRDGARVSLELIS